jgi:hypothetical protein
MSIYAAPNTENYAIMKANVWFTKSGGTRRHMGNVPTAELELALETLDHFSSMEGVKSKDKKFIITKGGTLKLTLEEITPANLAIFLLGEEGVDTEGNVLVEVLASTEVSGRLEIIGNGDYGPKITLDLPNVSFTPSSALGLITEEVASMELEGEILVSNGSFGTALFQNSAGTVL